MKMSTNTRTSTLSCVLRTAHTLRFRASEAWGLLPESAGYAACRYLSSMPELRHALVWESYQLRLARGRKSRRRSFVAPGELLELPGRWVRVDLSVTAEGVTVEGVSLYARFPEPRRRRRR